MHLGLIPDGNRRWAKSKGLEPWMGHWKGAEKIIKFMEWCLEFNIKKVSIYLLSTENLNRPKRELEELFKVFYHYFKKFEKGDYDELIRKYEVQINFLGNYRKLPKSLVKLMANIMKKTRKYRKRVLNFLVGYGGTYEILQAIKKVAKEFVSKRIRITEKTLQRYLMVKDRVDLIIRTGGYSRLSNFLPLQAIYAEIYVTKKLWPAFTKKDLLRALKWYSSIQRKFGS